MVDLPPPVGPTRAMVSPRLTCRLKSFSTGFSSSSSYQKVVWSNSISPWMVPGRRRTGPVGHFGHGVEQREDALGGGDGVLNFGEDARQVLDRPHHKGDVGDKGLDAADGHAAVLRLQAAVPDDAPSATAEMICTVGRNRALNQAAR
jgi:hypothetical protein